MSEELNKIMDRVKAFLENGEICTECESQRGECACGEELLEELYSQLLRDELAREE